MWPSHNVLWWRFLFISFWCVFLEIKIALHFHFVPCNCHKFIHKLPSRWQMLLIIVKCIKQSCQLNIFPWRCPSAVFCLLLQSHLIAFHPGCIIDHGVVFSIILELSSFPHLGCFSCFLRSFSLADFFTLMEYGSNSFLVRLCLGAYFRPWMSKISLSPSILSW